MPVVHVAVATPTGCSVAWACKVRPWRASTRHCDNPIESDLSAVINWPLRVLCPLQAEPDIDPTFHSRPPRSLIRLECLWLLSRADGALRVPTTWTQCPSATSWPLGSLKRHHIISHGTAWALLSGLRLSSLGEVGVLGQLPLLLRRVAALLPGLQVPKLDPPSRVNVHHVFLVCMRHHFDVFGHRERVVELPCWFGRGVVLNIWPHAHKSVLCQQPRLCPRPVRSSQTRENRLRWPVYTVLKHTSDLAVDPHVHPRERLVGIFVLRLTAALFQLVGDQKSAACNFIRSPLRRATARARTETLGTGLGGQAIAP